MMKKCGLFFIGFLFCTAESSAMRNAVTRAAIKEHRFTEIREESGLSRGLESIQALKTRYSTGIASEELVAMLHDAVENVKIMCDYVAIKETEGLEPAKVLADLYKQKRLCVEALYELYESVKSDFCKLSVTEEITKINGTLRALGVIE